jgi:hypothetical protein
VSGVFSKELSPTPFPSSYELFYPVVAGKTPADKYYFVKTIREWIVDKLLFDPIKNVDYHLTLSKKRLVESERLIADKSYQLAAKSVNNSFLELKKASKKAKTVSPNTDIIDTIKSVSNTESDFIEMSLVKNVPESEKQSFSETAKEIKVFLDQI